MCAGIWFIFTLLNIYTLNLYYRATSPKICNRNKFDFPNQLFFSDFKGNSSKVGLTSSHSTIYTIKPRHTKRQGHGPLTLPPLYSDAQSKEWNFRRSRDNGSFTHSAIIFCWLDSMAQLLPQGASCVFWVINNASSPSPHPRPRFPAWILLLFKILPCHLGNFLHSNLVFNNKWWKEMG